MSEDDRDVLTGNAADEAEVLRATRKERQRRRRVRAVWRQQLSTYDGREFVWMLLSAMHIFSAIGGDMQAVYMQLGLRNFGAEQLALLSAKHPEAYLQMQGEAMGRAERDAQENAAARTPPAEAPVATVG